MLDQVIFTGFEPFGPHARNPSSEVAEHAAQAASSWADTQSLVLPVEFRLAGKLVRQLRRDNPSAWILHIGLARNRSWVGIETTAWNLGEAEADNAGESHNGELDAAEPEQLKTGLPAARFAKALSRKTDLEVRLSDDAGRYVCNSTYFYALAEAKLIGVQSRVLFVHIPDIDADTCKRLGVALAGTLRWVVARS